MGVNHEAHGKSSALDCTYSGLLVEILSVEQEEMS